MAGEPRRWEKPTPERILAIRARVARVRISERVSAMTDTQVVELLEYLGTAHATSEEDGA